MPSDSFGPIPQEINNTDNSNHNLNNNENMNDNGIEKTLHQLLTQANDHFGQSDDTQQNHNQANYNNNDDNNNSANNSNDNNDNNSNNVQGKDMTVDFEYAIEHAISSMRSNSILDSNMKKLEGNDKNSDQDDDKPFTLDNILGEDQNSNMEFELDELDFSEQSKTNTQNNKNNNDTTENGDDLHNKRKFDEIDVHFQEFEKLSKSAKISSVKENDEPFLSPASLSPMSALSSDTNEVKNNEGDLSSPKQNNINNTAFTHKIQKQSLNKATNITPTTSMSPSIKLNDNNSTFNFTSKSTYYQPPMIPEKLTNQYTMHQVSEMKKRIINTHKLMLNFNFLKDSYAKTCVELKKSLNSLKDSEIHRAHLLLENEQLKARLLELEPIKKEES